MSQDNIETRAQLVKVADYYTHPEEALRLLTDAFEGYSSNELSPLLRGELMGYLLNDCCKGSLPIESLSRLIDGSSLVDPSIAEFLVEESSTRYAKGNRLPNLDQTEGNTPYF